MSKKKKEALAIKKTKKPVDKLNQLAPGKEEKAREQIFTEQKSQRTDNARHEYNREAMSYSAGGQLPMPTPPGIRRKERKAEKQEEKKG
jgi:hypothetical protein